MAPRLQRIKLASAAALALAAALPALQPSGYSFFSSAAYARGGHDGGSGSSGRGGSDDASGDDHGGGHDSGSNSGRGRSGGNSSDDDNGGDRHGGRTVATGADDSGRRGRENDRSDRPRVPLSVSAASLQGLLNGSLIAVDQLGRRLEVEVELEHGVQTVEVKPHRSDAVRNPGPITNVSIRPAAAP